MDAHVSVAGSYRPPVSRGPLFTSCPPQTIILPPVQTAVAPSLPVGTFAPTLVGNHESDTGLYRPPVLVAAPPAVGPPQTIISVPVHTATQRARGPNGRFAPVLVGVQESSVGL